MEKVELLIDDAHIKYMDLDTSLSWTKVRKFIMNDGDIKNSIDPNKVVSIAFRLHSKSENEHKYVNLFVNNRH